MSVLIRCIPLIDHGAVSGAVVLTRDVSELRRRDRLLLSKDATIREIHHRVKNNLQTISSLLRLQGRRFSSPEAKVAIEESVRRIRAIALVHETLSREAGDDVAFVEIVRPLARMVEEGMSSEDRPVSFTVEGDAGFLPATVATPLSVVLNELLQNAIDHAFPPSARPAGRAGARGGRRCATTASGCGPRWSTTASGCPTGSRSTRVAGLGLSIVRTLVTSELVGHDLARARHRATATGPGTVVRLDVPVAAPRVSRATRRTATRNGPLRGAGGRRDRKRDRGSWLGGAALAGDVLLAELAALLLGGAAPHAGVLVGGEGVLEARGLGLALPADGLGVLDLLDGGAGGADGEEQVGVGVPAQGDVAPVVALDGERQGAVSERGPRGSSAAGIRVTRSS